MNMDTQDPHEQYSIVPPPPSSTCLTAGMASSLNSSGEYVNVPTSYVTIGMMPPQPPPPSSSSTLTMAAANAMASQNISTTPGSTTSTFKTPLLPMPSLEDIEVGLATSSQTTNLPTGILKYPMTSSSTLNMGGMGPGPPSNTGCQSPLPPSHLSLSVATPSTSLPPPPNNLSLGSSTASSATVVMGDVASTCGTLKSSAKLQQPATLAVSTAQVSNSTAANIVAAITNNCNNPTATAIATTTLTSNSSSTVPLNLHSTTANSSKTSSRNNLHNRPASPKCCACFGGGGGNNNNRGRNSSNNKSSSSLSTKSHGGYTQTKGRRHSRHNSQTFWSAVLTNLGICALLLAYTLLASSPQMLEGMISLQNNDFGYGDDFTPQYALSPDTFDVRQRTIENIWDITVSLNILYKENWTKLAALEIAKFQDQLIKRLNEDAVLQLPHDTDVNGQTPATEAVLLFHQHGLTPHHTHHHHHEWNFARAFLYSLTVLTTIGYGNIAPRTTLGRLVTLAYAFFGIPLTLVYLSSTGGILAKVAREVFSKALCCCLCSNCGYCCYDEKRMAEKERRMKRKRQQEEMRKQQQAMQEPYYVRSGSMPDNFQTPEKQSLGNNSIQIPDLDSLSNSESRGSMHGLAILAPILLCFCMMIIYILFGAVVLYRLEEWPLLDGVYFCFMSLSTIGFGDMMPGFRRDSNTTIWFCSIYIMSGMALTAMCFNVIHEEIVNRIKIVVEFKKSSGLDTTNEDNGYYVTP
ncbi:hypothetical protein DOY81_005591 [Sarcophaga bullata]|nr:hypothetical protein DOY81_005591 [Sarcophaga bullata]